MSAITELLQPLLEYTCCFQPPLHVLNALIVQDGRIKAKALGQFVDRATLEHKPNSVSMQMREVRRAD